MKDSSISLHEKVIFICVIFAERVIVRPVIRSRVIVILLALCSGAFASLLFHDNRNDADLRDNPADRFSDAYQGYDTTDTTQSVEVANAAALQFGLTTLVQLRNTGWRPNSYMCATDASFDGAAWTDMPPDQLFTFKIPSVPGYYTRNCSFATEVSPPAPTRSSTMRSRTPKHRRRAETAR